MTGRTFGMMAAIVFVAGAGCTQSGQSFLGNADTGAGDVDASDADVNGGDGGDDTTPLSLGCAVAEELFTPSCTRCHNQNEIYPNLNKGALKYLVGTPAIAYPDETLVVAGDLAASFLYAKVHGPTIEQGLQMPPDEDVTPAGVAALEAWIQGGAPPCEGANDPGPMTPPLPTPGDVVSFTAAPLGFQTSKPSWSEEGSCTANQWWKYAGNTESASMHPGQDCIGCHHRENEGPVYSYAGTVYPGVDEASDCRGVSGVTVDIIDADDVVVATTTSNTAGNFYFRKSSVAFRPYRARLTYQGREREMTLVQHASGDCNTCHDSTGQQGTLGRIVVP